MIVQHNATITSDNLKTLFLCSVRYCLGRQTYMPSLVMSIIRTHNNVLSAQDCEQLVREIHEHNRLFGNIGADFDTRGWLQFADWLLEEAKKRSDES